MIAAMYTSLCIVCVLLVGFAAFPAAIDLIEFFIDFEITSIQRRRFVIARYGRFPGSRQSTIQHHSPTRLWIHTESLVLSYVPGSSYMCVIHVCNFCCSVFPTRADPSQTSVS